MNMNMLSTSWKIAFPGLLVTALLASCGSSPDVSSGATVPQPEVFAAPAAPLVVADTDLGQANVVAQRASAQIQAVLTPEALTPDLYSVLNALGLVGPFIPGSPPPSAGMPLSAGIESLNPRTLGRQLLSLSSTAVGAQGVVNLPDHLLPTGTTVINAQGMPTLISAEPKTGAIIINEKPGLTITIDWKVNGAATTMLMLSAGTDQYGVRQSFRQELPTSARVSVSKTASGKMIAAATFSMTPGACLETTGPEALKLDVWAGNAAQPELKASADYAWNAQGLSLKASASLSTLKGKASAVTDLKLDGTTSNRCDSAAFSFKPSRLDASASAEVPGDRLNAELKLRDVSNLEFSAAAMRVPNPFAKVQGKMLASADHNGQRFFSAFGPLADGPDLDLIPGDGVEVKYVQSGQLVTTNLQAFVVSLASLMK
jgi:hypothetical protein